MSLPPSKKKNVIKYCVKNKDSKISDRMNWDLRVDPPADGAHLRILRQPPHGKTYGHTGTTRVVGTGRSSYNGEDYVWSLNAVNVPSGPVYYDPTDSTTLPPNGPSDIVVAGAPPSTLDSVMFPFTPAGSVGQFRYLFIESDRTDAERIVDEIHGISFVLNLPTGSGIALPTRSIQILYGLEDCYLYAQYDADDPLSPPPLLPPDYAVVDRATADPIPSLARLYDGSTQDFQITVYPKSQVQAPPSSRLVLILRVAVSYDAVSSV